jgi:hypothetical protein
MIRGIQVIQPVFNADALKAREQANKAVQARRMAYQWGRTTDAVSGGRVLTRLYWHP